MPDTALAQSHGALEQFCLAKAVVIIGRVLDGDPESGIGPFANYTFQPVNASWYAEGASRPGAEAPLSVLTPRRRRRLWPIHVSYPGKCPP